MVIADKKNGMTFNIAGGVRLRIEVNHEIICESKK